MAIVIEPYTEQQVSAVKEFNRRLENGGVEEFRFPESPLPEWLPKLDQRRIYQEFFLALEDSAVRGTFILKHQDFSFFGQMRPVAYYHLPLSEGIINKTYTSVGVQLLRSALKMQPLMFALGMGGYDQPLPKMLQAMGWSLSTVPFLFHVNHPFAFLREIRALRKTRWRAALMDFAALSGAGWAAFHFKQRNNLSTGPFSLVTEFSGWSDHLWEQCKSRYAMIGTRDCQTLSILYPASRFLKLRVDRDGAALGWAVMLDTRMHDHKQFGNLRVGSIIDCLALPEDAPSVIAAATEFLKNRSVDLIVSNQSHAAWVQALRHAGFLNGPSNFLFATSKPLGELLQPFATRQHEVHLTRGDGDGPIHL